MVSATARRWALALLLLALPSTAARSTGTPTPPRVPGTFVVRMAEVTKPELRTAGEWVRAAFAPSYHQVADLLSANMRFEGTIPIIFSECGQVNAFWYPAQNQLVMCYEIVDYIDRLTAQQYPTDSTARLQAFAGALTFILYHELGHALVDILDLPVTGREEDVADQLASYFFSMAPGNVVYAADYFRESGRGSRTPFYDAHSLGEQRFYNLVCWYYGSDPEAHKWVVSQGHLPEDRAKYCPQEHRTMQRAWARLLQPHWVSATTGPDAPGGRLLTLGMYTLEIPAGTTVNQLQNGVLELDAPGRGKAHIAAQPNLTYGAATMMLPTVAQHWNPQQPLQFLEGAAESQLEHLGGSGAHGFYQQNLVDQRGPNVVHGIFYLHVRHGGQGVTIDVFDTGQASGADWKPLIAFLNQLLGKLRVQAR
jgi:hypothetical protein